MKKKIISIITATLMFMGFGFTANAQEAKSITPVILDVDMATDVDDATAVRICTELDVEGIIDLKGGFGW